MNTAKKMLATLEDAKTLQPGTWVTIAWNDAPHEVALFLSYDRNYARSYKNDRGLVLYRPSINAVDHSAVHIQVTRILGPLKVPA